MPALLTILDLSPSRSRVIWLANVDDDLAVGLDVEVELGAAVDVKRTPGGVPTPLSMDRKAIKADVLVTGNHLRRHAVGV